MADCKVRKIDKEQGKVTLKHGPIASLDMPGLGVGLSPLVQWLVLPPLLIWMVQRQLISPIAR